MRLGAKIERSIKIRYLLFASLLFIGAVGLFFEIRSRDFGEKAKDVSRGLTKAILAKAMSSGSGRFETLPAEVQIPIEDLEHPSQQVSAILQYTMDSRVQNLTESLFKSYQPDYGAVVMLDATTGRILGLASFTKKAHELGHLALRASFPSASVFKVVTAAAAIAEKNFTASTLIPFNGSYHTLYRKNVLKNDFNRWTRQMSLKDAFAKSVNTVFAKIGSQTLGADSLIRFADRFGFNRDIASDLPLEMSRALIESDPWSLAGTASGFTQDNRMSPLQGALIAAAMVNDGVMMEPYGVQSAHMQDGTVLYEARPERFRMVVDPETAREIRTLMKETITSGTSRKSFKGFFKKELAFVDVGGKTGSLTGDSPKGKYDWFVGYGSMGTRKVAIAALTIHEKYWTVKSSYLARRILEDYFKAHALDAKVAQVGAHRAKSASP